MALFYPRTVTVLRHTPVGTSHHSETVERGVRGRERVCSVGCGDCGVESLPETGRLCSGSSYCISHDIVTPRSVGRAQGCGTDGPVQVAVHAEGEVGAFGVERRRDPEGVLQPAAQSLTMRPSCRGYHAETLEKNDTGDGNTKDLNQPVQY